MLWYKVVAMFFLVVIIIPFVLSANYILERRITNNITYNLSDGFWPITGPYLFNNSGSLDVNETKLNETIDDRSGGGVTDVWVNESGDTMSGNLVMGWNSIRNINETRTKYFDLDAFPADHVEDFDDEGWGRLFVKAAGSEGYKLQLVDSAALVLHTILRYNDLQGPDFDGVEIGYGADSDGDRAVAIGSNSSTDHVASDSVAIGHNATAEVANCTAIGVNALCNESNTVVFSGDIIETMSPMTLAPGGTAYMVLNDTSEEIDVYQPTNFLENVSFYNSTGPYLTIHQEGGYVKFLFH